MNKKKTKSTNWGSKWICLFCCFFFFLLPFRTLLYETFGLSWCLSASWDFLLRCYKTRYSKCLPGMLVYLNSDNCVLEVWTKMDFQSECWTLPAVFWGGFGGVWTRWFSLAVQPTGQCVEIDPPCATLERSFGCQIGTFSFSQKCVFVFFFFRNATKLWVSGVGRLQSSFEFIKHNQFFFCCCFGEKEKKETTRTILL